MRSKPGLRRRSWGSAMRQTVTGSEERTLPKVILSERGSPEAPNVTLKALSGRPESLTRRQSEGSWTENPSGAS
jgi:hypothetical protein